MSEPNLSKEPRSDEGPSGFPSDPAGGPFSPYRPGQPAWDEQTDRQPLPTYEAPRYDAPAYDAAWNGGQHPGAVGIRPTNGMAVAALVAAIAGWTVVPGIGLVIGIILGHMARAQIRTSGEQGAGFALAALVIGYASIALFAVLIFILFAFFAGISGLLA